MKVEFFFKLFNNIKSEHEAKQLAYYELKALFGEITPIHNVVEIVKIKSFGKFADKENRIQDLLTYELPYGDVHGYYGSKDDIADITSLVKRLAYIKEIYAVIYDEIDPLLTLKQLYPQGIEGKNVQIFKKENYVLFRIITHQYYLEKSQYISKLSRNEKEIDRNIDILLRHLFVNQYRIPASSTMAVGKRLIDYFAIREEPSLYLNHYMHPYKGKFHPKMARSLINYTFPSKKGLILDNFCGSGTTLVEAGYMNIDSIGVEINPLSVLMCNVKTNSVKIEPSKLKKQIINFLQELKDHIKSFNFTKKGQSKLTGFIQENEKDKLANITPSKINLEAKEKIKLLKGPLKEDIKKVEEIIIAREIINEIQDVLVKDFFLLSLSGTISDVNRRTRKSFLEAFEERLMDLYHRLYLYNKLNKILNFGDANSKTYVSDTRDMKQIKDSTIDAIINSPPYSTALDYIRNDEPQLILLNLVKSFKELEANMMGNPRLNFDKKEIMKMILSEENPVFTNSEEGKRFVKILLENNREDAGLRVFKFFLDMFFSLKEMFRVQKSGSKCAIVIGNNHFKINDYYQEIANDVVLEELGLSIGYKKDLVIFRELEKSSSGNIRTESIVILEKP
ncbi:MAG: DNA methyltransferase [Candidatus Heimdallarchaeaceae archaeon]